MKKRRFNKVALLIIIICGLWFILPKAILWMNDELSEIHWPELKSVIGKKLPFHQIYESRQIRLTSDVQKTTTVSNVTKIILLWTPWNGIKKTKNYYSLQLGDKSFVTYKCPVNNCATTYNRKYLKKADAVMFHLLDVKSHKMPSTRTANQVWIMSNMEGPWLIQRKGWKELKRLKNVFNWTMTYRADSTIPVKYGFIEKNDASQLPPVIPNKTRNVVWFVSDCKTDSKREAYVKELMKHIDVDVYGECGDLKCYPSQSSVCYEDVLKRYKYYLSFENSLCKDYVTEKFFNVFNYDIIPIVFGDANYSAIAPAGTFIDATQYPDPKNLAYSLWETGSNKEEYERMLKRKQSFQAYLDPWMCRLCKHLHEPIQPQKVGDIAEWWIKDGHCRYWYQKKLAFIAK